MSNFKNCFLLATSSLIMVLFFSCKRKSKIEDNTKQPGVITANSFYLQDFEIQDASDARVLDFQNIHRIAQASVENVAQGAVDTIYFSVLATVDMKSLKLKPHFYDTERVTAIETDTSQARDLTKYDGKDYPTLKVTFNTGLSRTFAIVASIATPNQDNLNLLLNQNIYYISQYQVSNGVNDIVFMPILLNNHTPIFKQNYIKDTIVFSVTTDDIASTNQYVLFTPSKYGKDNTDTVVATFNPTTLSFDKNTESDVYKTMNITFKSGFTREYAVKVSIVNLNIALNRDKYFIKNYKVENKTANDITSSVLQDSFTCNTPTDLLLQRDTIVLTIPNLQYDNYPIAFKPNTYGIDGNTSTTYTLSPSNGLSFALADTGLYKTLTITFPNGFQRVYDVKLHQEPKSTNPVVAFTNFIVLNNGNGAITYAKLKDSSLDNGYTIINSADSGVIIVRPLLGWNGGRSVTLQFTGLDAAVTGSLSLYPNAPSVDNLGNSSTSALSANGQIVVDFSNISTDSVLLTLQNVETRHYKIKLLSGKMKGNPTLKMTGAGGKTGGVFSNYPLSSGGEDKEFKVAVDDNNVYVLIMNANATPTAIGSIFASDWGLASYDLYTYSITTTAGSVTKIQTGGNKIIDIVSDGKNLYGISLANTTISTPNTAGSKSNYQIWKWTLPAGTTPPDALCSPTTGNDSLMTLFTANITADSVIFYSVASTINTNNPSAVRIGASLLGTAMSTPKAIYYRKNWSATAVGGSTYNAGYAMFINLSGICSIITGGGSGITLGNDFENTGSITPKVFARYNSGGNINPIGGANIEKIRDKYYLVLNSVFASTTNLAHRMDIIDLGKNIKQTIDGLTAIADLYAKSIFQVSMGGTAFSNGVNIGNRGNVRTFKMPDGSIRIVSMVPLNGFKVWDME